MHRASSAPEWPDDSDSTLVRAAQAGDMGAFEVLLDRHRPVLLAVCRHTLGDSLWAEDATQEATLQALLHLTRLEHPERFRSWLAGIGMNICRMWLRRRGREGVSWDALHGVVEHGAGRGDPEVDRLAAPIRRAVRDLQAAHDPSYAAEAADLAATVRQAVADLPPGQQAAVLLFYVAGRTYVETATLLGIEVGAVRTRLHKARQALRRPLRALWKEETMTEDGKRVGHICTFCGKSNDQVERMIAGPAHLGGSVICNECVARCNEVIAAEEAKASA